MYLSINMYNVHIIVHVFASVYNISVFAFLCNVCINVPYRSFFSRETIFADFVDFGTILENWNCKLYGGYGQWPGEIGNPWNLNPQKYFFSKSASEIWFPRKKDLYSIMRLITLHPIGTVHVHCSCTYITYFFLLWLYLGYNCLRELFFAIFATGVKNAKLSTRYY